MRIEQSRATPAVTTVRAASACPSGGRGPGGPEGARHQLAYHSASPRGRGGGAETAQQTGAGVAPNRLGQALLHRRCLGVAVYTQWWWCGNAGGFVRHLRVEREREAGVAIALLDCRSQWEQRKAHVVAAALDGRHRGLESLLKRHRQRESRRCHRVGDDVGVRVARAEAVHPV